MWIRRGMKYKGCGQEKLGRLVATLVCKLKKLSLMVASLVFLPWALAQTAATSVEKPSSYCSQRYNGRRGMNSYGRCRHWRTPARGTRRKRSRPFTTR